MMEGIIYILSNPAMPGIVKIGKTTKEDVKLSAYSGQTLPVIPAQTRPLLLDEELG